MRVVMEALREVVWLGGGGPVVVLPSRLVQLEVREHFLLDEVHCKLLEPCQRHVHPYVIIVKLESSCPPWGKCLP